MIKNSIKKPSQHCSDAIHQQRKILEGFEDTPVYFPSAIVERQNLVNFTKDGIKRLREAVKFRVPYAGNILIDMVNGTRFKDAIAKFLPEYRLPFPLMAIEFDFHVDETSNDFIPDNLPYLASIIVLQEQVRPHGNPILVARFYNKIFSPMSKKYEWHGLPYDVLIDFDKCAQDDSISYFTSIIPATPSYLKDHNQSDFFHDTINEISVVLQFLIAMSCKNVTSQTDIPPSVLDNKKRTKKGLEKRYPYRNIVINTKFGTSALSDKSGFSNGNKGGIKSTHIRRGHIRHYEDKNVWIEQTVVNADKGSSPTPKNYTLK